MGERCLGLTYIELGERVACGQVIILGDEAKGAVANLKVEKLAH